MAQFIIDIQDNCDSTITPDGFDSLEPRQQIQTLIHAAVHFNLFVMRTLRLEPGTYWQRIRECSDEAAKDYLD